MVSNEKLIEIAKKTINVKKTETGKIIGDVGAAILSESGKIYVGLCIDTHEGSGICAERSAIAAMISSGETKIKKIVAVWTDGTVISPCGACREWIWQIDKENWETQIVITKEKTVPLTQLLPYHWHNPQEKEKIIRQMD